jgi:hypothetical protein
MENPLIITERSFSFFVLNNNTPASLNHQTAFACIYVRDYQTVDEETCYKHKTFHLYREKKNPQ